MENVEVIREEDTPDREDFDSFSEFKLADIRNVGLRVGESYIDNLGSYRINSERYLLQEQTEKKKFWMRRFL
jgi:hypothetical protein